MSRLSRRSALKTLASGLAGLAAYSALAPVKKAHALMFIGAGGTAAQQQSYGIFNVQASPYSATGNGVMLTTGVMSSSVNPTHLSDVNASFAAGDVGKPICVGGAGTSGRPLVTTIASVTDGTHVVLAGSCATTVSAAIVHYGTDDTVAVQAAITACYNAGGGIVFFPAGIYFIGGALQNPSTQNAQLTIPYRNGSTSTIAPLSIAFVGVSLPTIGVGCCGLLGNNLPPMAKGSILFTPLNGSGTQPALIASYNAGAPTDFSQIELVVASLYLRSAYLNTTPLTMINAQWCSFMSLDSVTIDVDATDNQQAATAPVTGGVGAFSPNYDNGAMVRVQNCLVTGYDTGYVWGEHGDFDNVQAHLCNLGYNVQPAFHSMRGGRIAAYRCVNGFFCAGPAGGSNPSKAPLYIEAYATEHSITGWYQTTADVVDGNNAIFGKMVSYNVVKSGTGYFNAGFVKTGGTNFTCTALF